MCPRWLAVSLRSALGYLGSGVRLRCGSRVADPGVGRRRHPLDRHRQLVQQERMTHSGVGRVPRDDASEQYLLAQARLCDAVIARRLFRRLALASGDARWRGQAPLLQRRHTAVGGCMPNEARRGWKVDAGVRRPGHRQCGPEARRGVGGSLGLVARRRGPRGLVGVVSQSCSAGGGHEQVGQLERTPWRARQATAH